MKKFTLSKQIRIRPDNHARIEKILESHPSFRYPDELIGQMLDDREDSTRKTKGAK